MIRLIRDISRNDACEIIEAVLLDLDDRRLGDVLDFLLLNHATGADRIDAREVVYRVNPAAGAGEEG